MVKIAQNILDQNQNELLPIDSKLQNRILRDTGGEFLHLLRACTMTAREKFDPELSGIDSWGEHLVKIAESFKDIASYELRHFDGGRKMRDEPKQAFRIEIVDDFVLSGIERELYEDLVRYGVFLRDDRGKSIRGAIIPRLYLRRLLIPFCTLTFSKIDNISMKSDEFKELLLKPKSCFTKWKRKRERRPKDVHGQKQFEFEE